MAIAWNDATMKTGVQLVDSQHKSLIDKVNELMEAAAKGKGTEVIGGILDFLANYAVTHFKQEEEIMAKVKCPTEADNKAAHAAFLKDFVAIKAKFDKEGPTPFVALEIQQKVAQWLINHICRIDMGLKGKTA